jgi:hypothetical protein
MIQPPKRRFALTLTIGAGDAPSLARALHQLGIDVLRGDMRGQFAEGGLTSVLAGELVEDASMTHAAYMAALDKYLAGKDDEQPTGC